MSLTSNVKEKADLIWSIADKLTGVYKPHEYGRVILPLTVIRRFDCVLAKNKAKVLEVQQENLPDSLKERKLLKVSGYSFYNVSPFTFEKRLCKKVCVSPKSNRTSTPSLKSLTQKNLHYLKKNC